jgi:hypothetical protein
MVNFLYPSTIAISRPNPNTGVGAQSYSGVTQADESILATNIAAHVQADRQGTRPEAGLPADAAGQSIWKIIFMGAKGIALERDVLTDEQGKRYQVIAADWGPLVTTCRCQLSALCASGLSIPSLRRIADEPHSPRTGE